MAWKTGTSYGFRDAWALGGTARYTVGVWVGRPDGTPMPGQYGAITALPLMFAVVDSLPQAIGRPRRPRHRPRSHAGDLLAAGPAQGQHGSRRCAVKRARPGRSGWRAADLRRARCPAVEFGQTGGARRRRFRTAAFSQLRLATCRENSRHRALAERGLSVAADFRAARDCDSAIGGRLRCRQPGCDGSAANRRAGAGQRACPRAEQHRAPQVRLRALGTNARVRWLVNGELVGESQGGAGFVHAFGSVGDQRITALADTGAWAELRLRVLR